MSSQILLLICSSLLFYSKLSSSFFIYFFSPSFLSFFYLFQFLSNFLRYSSSKFLSSHPYNSFTVYLPGNSPLLNFSASEFNFIFFSFLNLILRISSLNLSFSNSFIFFIAFFKFSNPSYVFSSTIYPFHFTRYFILFLLSCLSKISSTSYSFSLATLIGDSGIFFCPSTCFLYFTILLTLTTKCILNDLGNSNFTTFSDTIFLTTYGPINFSINFFIALFINSIKKSFVLISTLSPTLYSSASFLFLSACLFISSYDFINAALASLCFSFISFTNSSAFSFFPFFLMSKPILSSLL